MKRIIITVILLLFILGVVLAESNSLFYSYVKDDWFAVYASENAILPEGLSDHEIEVYRAAYANGFYDALHPAYIEGTYMLNLKTKKYHLTNCPTTLQIETKNREYSTLTPDELNAKGFDDCGMCHPATPTAEGGNTSN